MSEGIVISLIGVIGTAVTIVVSKVVNMKSAKVGLIDELQEEVKGYRDEIRALRADLNAFKMKSELEADHNATIIRHLDDEVIGLRQDISAGLVPPLRPRPPWPLRNP